MLVTAGAVLGENEYVYFGNLHSHTSYSDGSGTPDQAFRHARYIADIDFLAITEHNHRNAESNAPIDRRDGVLIATNPALYTADLMTSAERWTEDGEFVALYGQEVSSIGRGNHVNVYDVGEVVGVPNGKFEDLILWLSGHWDSSGRPALMQLNHPTLYDNESDEYGRDDFGGSDAAWVAAIDAHAQLIEVLSGPATARSSGHRATEVAEEEYLRYLALGFHVGPTGGQDNHYFTWGTATRVRTGVIAPALTKAALYEALRSRHVYATEDENLRLIFKVNGRLCGDRISAPPLNSELDIELMLHDDDEPDEWYDIEVYSGVIGQGLAEVIDVYSLEGNSAGEAFTIEDVRFTSGPQYVFFKVTQYAEHGGVDRAWTAPVWFEPPGWEPRGAVFEHTGGFLASRRSSIYHTSAECLDARRIKDANLLTGAEAAQGRRRHVPCPRLR